ncbi:MAG: hypothetical protein IJE05_01100 [Clostridia bacterium]|nr:hypothetical protein [Clostridia bacterium]
MSKKNIIFICISVAIIFIIAFVLYFIFNNKTNDKITLIQYDSDFNVKETFELTNNKQIKEINNICENISLEQDDTTPYLAIRNDVKLDLGNGKFFTIQLNLSEYCYYEDLNSNTKLVIKMPERLLEKVNEILK